VDSKSLPSGGPRGAADLTIRQVDEGDLESFALVLQSAFDISSQEAATLMDRLEGNAPLRRTLAAFAGSELVGTLGCYPFELTVPGGTLPMAGTAVVSVDPQHRRKGVMHALMRSHLDDIRETGDPLAGLWASDATLYGRYGYGPATDAMVLHLDSREADFRTNEAGLPARSIEFGEAQSVLPAVYDRIRRDRPGLIRRADVWWRLGMFADAARGSSQDFSRRFAVHGIGECIDGYVAYSLRPESVDRSEAHVKIVEIMAETPESYMALWKFVTHVEEFPIVEYSNLPVDDELRWLLVDPRSALSSTRDALWLRILDVEQALAGRAYGEHGTLSIRIMDPVYEDNSGTYLLDLSGDVALCVRSGGVAEISMDIDVLSSIYLGGRAVAPFVRAGRIRCSPEVARKADRFFKWHRAPWCPESF